MVNEITLDNGTQLTLRGVSQVTLGEIINDLGGFDLQRRLSEMSADEVAAHFAAYSAIEKADYLAAQRRQMLYCFGWGIADDPPEDAIAALEMMGRNSTFENVRRAHWLLYAANLTRADKARIIGMVMALTYFGVSDG